jgi:hypothetical protein
MFLKEIIWNKSTEAMGRVCGAGVAPSSWFWN